MVVASLLTYALFVTEDRAGGYGATLVVISVTAVLGVLMYLKWKRGDRARVRSAAVRTSDDRPEDRLPRPVIYAHGTTATVTAALVVALLVVDR